MSSRSSDAVSPEVDAAIVLWRGDDGWVAAT